MVRYECPMRGLVLLFGLTADDFQNVHFSSVTTECQVVDLDVDGFPGFSGNLFAVLVYYFEVGDIGGEG